MKKKLAKPLSLLLTVAMVVGVAQTGFPHVYAAEGEVGGEGASVRPAEDWDGPAGSPGELAASEEQEFVFPFVTTGSAVLAELEFDIYLGKDGDNAEENRDYKTSVQFDLKADDAPLTLNASDINSALQNNLLKDQEIAFYEAAGAEFHYEGGKAVSVKEDSIDIVKENLSYISEDDNKTGEWEFSLKTTLLAEKGYSDIEFLVAAHTDDPEVSWGNNNYNAPEKGDTQAYLYTIKAEDPDEGETEAKVGTADKLKEALADEDIETIQLTEDITIDSGENLVVTNPVTIDGNNHKLSFSGLDSKSNDTNDALVIAAEDSTVKNLTVDAGLTAAETWKGSYAIQAYNTSGVVLQEVKATGANGGIYVNSSTVTLEGTIDVSGNGFGGIEISNGANPVGDLMLTAQKRTRFINTSEAYGRPTVWLDGITKENADEYVDGLYRFIRVNGDNQTLYYLDEAHRYDPEAVATVGTIGGLQDALKKDSIDFIRLTEDITGVSSSIEVKREVVIDGDGHTLGFENLEGASSTVDDGLILYQPATVKNLIVDAGLKDLSNNPEAWKGTYAIHVYNTEGVILEGVTATGANGGILVNSSDVTLKGNIDVSGNGFGGIEVSKANESADDPYLNGEENVSFANSSEAYGEPTIWVDGTADKDEAENWLTVDEDTFTTVPFTKNSKNQVHYYLDAAHSVELVPDSPQITVTGVPEGTVSTENKIAETDVGKITEFSADARTPIQVSLTKGSEDYNNVRVIVTLVKEDAEVTEGIQLIAQDTNHAWWNIVKSGWGPGEGFELKDAETDVYLVAYEPGEYTANIQLIDVSDKNNVVVLAEKSASITAVAPEILHTVTLTNGGTGSSGGGSYAATTTVSINAGTRSGYSFNGWTASPAITFANAASAVTTFIMPDTNVTVTANWRSNSSSRDDDDSSSGGSSSKPSAGNQDTSGTVTTNPAPGGGTVTTVTTQPSSTVITGGAAQITATVPDSAAAAIASATPQSPAQVSISVPTAAVTQQLQNAEVTRASLTITVPPAVANNTNASAQVVVNADAGLLNAARVAGKDLEITIQNAQTGRTAYAWSFSGSALAQATEIRSLNLALSVQPTSSVPAAQSAAPSSAGIVLRFANNGQLPAPATVTVDVSSQGYQPGQVLYFYYLNPNTGRLEAMNNAQPITVNAQGYAAVTVTHNSDFVLLPKKPGSLTLDTVSYTLPKGKAYEIGAKLAGEGATLKVTPSRSGIVKIENTKSGNYKVTGLTNGITYVSFDVYSGGKLVSHSSVKIMVQSSGKAQGVAGRRVMNF